MSIKIKLRRDSSINWSTNNPILELGEPGVETDTKRIKIGDGVSTWNNLSYIQIDVADIDFLNTSNVSEGTNLYFTNTRARDAFTPSGNIEITAGGVVSFNGTTDFIPEGSSNLYFTAERAVSALVAGEGLSIEANGLITLSEFGNVFSVNGLTGDVVLYTSDIDETSRLYFTDERVYDNVIQMTFNSSNIVDDAFVFFSNAQVYDNVIQIAFNTSNLNDDAFVFFSNDRVYANVIELNVITTSSFTTANIVEDTNLFFTNTRSVDALTAGTFIAIESNGLISSTVTPGANSFAQLSEPIQAITTFDRVVLQPFVTLNVSDNIESNGFFFASHYGSNENPDVYVLSATSIAFNLNGSVQQLSVEYDEGSGFNTYENATHINSSGAVTTGSSASGIGLGTLQIDIPFGFTGNLRYVNTNDANVYGNIIVKDISLI